MRRLGRALLRSSLMRRTAALTVLLGLLGASSVLVTSTVYAATHGPGLLGSLGLSGDEDQQGDGQPSSGLGISIPQAACQLLPVLCRPGTRLIQVPSGVLTLGRPAAPPAPPAPAATPRHVRPHLAAPLTGSSCNLLTSLVGCSTPTPAATASPTAKPTTTTSSSTSTPAPSSTPTPSASAGSCGLLGLDLLCTPSPVSGSSTGSPTPTPAPSQGLCLLSCNLVQLGGNCVASLLQTCVGQTSSSPPSQGSGSGSGSGSTGSSSGACVANLVCLLGSSCTAQVVNTCLIGALLPGLPGGGSPSEPSGPTAPSGGGSGSSGGSTPQGGSQPTGASSPQGFLPLALTPAGSFQPSAAGGGNSAPITSQPPKGDQSVGLVSGLSFGHGLILWPLFGLLDLAALAGLVVVVRRRWSATSG
jgi:hypothetical protein